MRHRSSPPHNDVTTGTTMAIGKMFPDGQSTSSSTTTSSASNKTILHHNHSTVIPNNNINKTIIWIALGCLLVVNVTCFFMLAVLIQEEPVVVVDMNQNRNGRTTASSVIVALQQSSSSSSSSTTRVLDTTTNPNEPHTNTNHNTIFLRRNKAKEDTVTTSQNNNNNNTTSTIRNNNNNHNNSIIPKILIFTHSIDLLHEDLNVLQDDTAYEELVALQDNVLNIIDLHNNNPQENNTTAVTVRFLTNEDCKESIRNTVMTAMFHNNNNNNTNLTEEWIGYFEREPTGMFKADLCRGMALWETGGLYFDVDLGVRMNIFPILQPQTEFATIRVHPQSQHPGSFFQAFIAVTPHHPVIRRYLELFLQYYRGNLPQVRGGPIGVLLLKMAFDQVEDQQRKTLLSSVSVVSTNSTTSMQTAMTNSSTMSSLWTTRLNQTSEIWQEFHYNWEYEHTLLAHVPPPTWGTRRACKFIVLSAPTLPLTVPFYSRIAGSRMCPRSNHPPPPPPPQKKRLPPKKNKQHKKQQIDKTMTATRRKSTPPKKIKIWRASSCCKTKFVETIKMISQVHLV